GVDRLDEVAAKLANVLEMQPPAGLADKLRGLKQLKSIADSRPRMVRGGACQEVVLRGDEVDLGALPIQTCWPGDAAPFVTLPAVITRDPRTGQRNVGMYRLQKLGPRTTAMHWQIHKDGRADYLFTDGRMEVAVALGLDPVTAYSASAPLPRHIDELMFAGFLRGDSIDVVNGVTVDLPVAVAFHNCCIVSIRKTFPGQARKVMHAVWGLGLLSLTKTVIVVDAHVDVHDYEQVTFYVGANVDPARDVMLSEGPLDHLDHAPEHQFVGGKLGIDATAKLQEEGARRWPEEIEMSDEIRALVDRRWAEYGIHLGTHPEGGPAHNGSKRHSSSP